MAYFLALGILSLAGIIGTVWLVRTDGYGRIPTDTSRLPDSACRKAPASPARAQTTAVATARRQTAATATGSGQARAIAAMAPERAAATAVEAAPGQAATPAVTTPVRVAATSRRLA